MSSDRYGKNIPVKYQGAYRQSLASLEKGLDDEPSTSLTVEEMDLVFDRLEAMAREAQELHDLIHEGFAPGSPRQRFEGVMLQILKAVEVGKRKWYELLTGKEFPAFKLPEEEKE